jgi:hypothetical protein
VKAEKAKGLLRALSIHYERGISRANKRATRRALGRYAASIGLGLVETR